MIYYIIIFLVPISIAYYNYKIYIYLEKLYKKINNFDKKLNYYLIYQNYVPHRNTINEHNEHNEHNENNENNENNISNATVENIYPNTRIILSNECDNVDSIDKIYLVL